MVLGRLRHAPHMSNSVLRYLAHACLMMVDPQVTEPSGGRDPMEIPGE